MDVSYSFHLALPVIFVEDAFGFPTLERSDHNSYYRESLISSSGKAAIARGAPLGEDYSAEQGMLRSAAGVGNRFSPTYGWACGRESANIHAEGSRFVH